MKTSEMLSVSGLAAVVGSVATMFTSSLTYFNNSRELDIQMVNVALTILSAKERGTDTAQARRYALRALEKYGGVDIPDKEFEQWATTGTVPSGDFPTWSLPKTGKFKEWTDPELQPELLPYNRPPKP